MITERGVQHFTSQIGQQQNQSNKTNKTLIGGAINLEILEQKFAQSGIKNLRGRGDSSLISIGRVTAGCTEFLAEHEHELLKFGEHEERRE